ncbi:hypothetical protein BH09VER1_BH09VER1_40320 [soil metagenome]
MRTLLFFLLFSTVVGARGGNQSPWTRIALGPYTGYGDMFSKVKGEYVLDNGCTPLGGEVALIVSDKGISWNGAFYAWEAPGLQATRTHGNEYERMSIRGKSGSVTVIDLLTEQPKGTERSMLRMTVAPSAK